MIHSTLWVRPFFWTIVAIAFLAVVNPAHALRVGFFTLEPHAMVIDEKAGGAAVEYLRDFIAPKMEEPVVFEGPIPFARLLFDFRGGKHDAVLLLAKNPERAKQFSYPEVPFGQMESALLVNKGFKNTPLTSPKDLEGVLIGYTNKAWRAPFMRDSSLQFDMVAAQYATEINFRKFNEGRLGAVYNPDRIALLYRSMRHKQLRSHRIIPVPGPAVGFYTVFSPYTPKTVIRKYEEALRQVLAETPYETIVDQYLLQ